MLDLTDPTIIFYLILFGTPTVYVLWKSWLAIQPMERYNEEDGLVENLKKFK